MFRNIQEFYAQRVISAKEIAGVVYFQILAGSYLWNRDAACESNNYIKEIEIIPTGGESLRKAEGHSVASLCGNLPQVIQMW